MQKYPSIPDLKRRARRRIPKFAFDYVEGSTGLETSDRRNRSSLDELMLIPRYMVEVSEIDLSTELFGRTMSLPFGIAPMGLGGLMWPNAEHHLARAAAHFGMPYGLSTVCTASMEEIPPLAGEHAWFQLYAPGESNVMFDLLQRALDSGFSALAVTVDVPTAGRRERDIKNGLSIPPRISPRTIYEAALRPTWSVETLSNGLPRFRTLEPYVPPGEEIATFIGRRFSSSVTWDVLDKIRAFWPHPLMLKGTPHAEEAQTAVDHGFDAIWVSNHGGRQLEASPAPADVLEEIIEAVDGRAKIIVDGGVSSGVDIARYLALGADYVMCGRAFMYGVSALGSAGGKHAAEILIDGLRQTLAQIGCPSVAALDRSWLRRLQ
jgi:L-lactate dehydrogenase (cytochrome)